MSDMKPCPICDASMIKHCPNEKAALKYCGKSMMGELSRLRAELAQCGDLQIQHARAIAALAEVRAELAAEKKALAGLVNAADQLAAKSFFYDGFETKQIDALSLNILERAADNARPYAAIRASNAAPVDAKQSCAESNSCAETSADEITWEEACAVGARIAKDREDV